MPRTHEEITLRIPVETCARIRRHARAGGLSAETFIEKATDETMSQIESGIIGEGRYLFPRRGQTQPRPVVAPHRRRRQSAKSTVWTPDKDAALTRLWGENRTYAQIAGELGVKESDIPWRRKELGLPPRGKGWKPPVTWESLKSNEQIVADAEKLTDAMMSTVEANKAKIMYAMGMKAKPGDD
jgi:hypothetical protein